MKKGTLSGTGKAMKNASKSGVKHGPAVKNVKSRGKSAGRPSGPTAPIKGSDRGGV